MPKEVIWKLEDIQRGLKRYYDENGRYPTAIEFDDCDYLPTAKLIQRRFGGLVKLRKCLGLAGPNDYTKGRHSSARASTILARSNDVENQVHRFLIARFGEPFVHREFLFDKTRRCRTDFYVYTREGGFAVDVFYPKDRHSLIGCINSKLRTYRMDLEIKYPIIFLMMNEKIGDRDLEIKRKKKLSFNQYVMSFERFESFCLSQSPYSLV